LQRLLSFLQPPGPIPGQSSRTFACIPFLLVSICAESTFAVACIPRQSECGVGKTHGRQLTHSIQQNSLATPRSRGAGWQNLRAQPASATRPDGAPAPSRRATRGTRGEHGSSHRRAGRPVSLALPPSGPAPTGMKKTWLGFCCIDRLPAHLPAGDYRLGRGLQKAGLSPSILLQPADLRSGQAVQRDLRRGSMPRPCVIAP
jgi:hypothetical protein